MALSGFFGMLLAVPVGAGADARAACSRRSSRGFTTTIRGTPLLVQVYLIYYGVGDLLAQTPEIRQSFLWPYLRDGFWYAVLAFTISVAAYEGEILRGGFLAVPRGELEAARACGMSRFMILRRVWLPRAVADLAARALRRGDPAPEIDAARLHHHRHRPDGRREHRPRPDVSRLRAAASWSPSSTSRSR